MDDVYVYIRKFPKTVRAMTILHKTDYIVFLNEYLGERSQKTALKHELKHIKYNHIYNEIKPVSMCEKEAIS